MGNIILREPLKNPIISQSFGADFQIYRDGKYVWFYKDIYGLKGHGGIDYRCVTGTPIYASHDGVCMYASYDDINGNLVQIWNEKEGFKTMYGHNSVFRVKQGNIVKAGQLIALSGGTGDGTGQHCHFGVKLTGEGGNGLNNDNGYNGAINPAPFIKLDYKGNNINSMRFKKIKGEPSVYLVDDIKGTRTMIIDMPTLTALEGEIEEVDNMAGYIDKGTLAWFERIIN